MAIQSSKAFTTSSQCNVLPLRKYAIEPPRIVEGVFFDLDSVLYDESAWRRWLMMLVGRVGIQASCDSFFRTFHDDYAADDTECEKSYWQAMRRYLVAVGCPPCAIDEIVGAGRAKRRDLLSNTRPLAGVAETLARLSTSLFPLAVVSSSRLLEAIIYQRLKRVGLSDWFRAISCVSSADTLEDWQHTLKLTADELGATTRRCAYVSANPLALLQAQRCSLKTFAFNAPSSAICDATLHGFADLTKVLSCERTRLLAG